MGQGKTKGDALMATYKFLFHVHTKASYDSLMSPVRVVKHCHQNGIHALAICDHDSTASINLARSIGQRLGVTIIPAIEYATDAGDIIALFANTTTRSRHLDDVVEHTHAHGGLIVLPHPARGHDPASIPMDMIDLVEIYNSRCSTQENAIAAGLVEQHLKPTLVGPDAHLPSELGLALNVFELLNGVSPESMTDEDIKQLLLKGERSFHYEKTNAGAMHLSQMIKGMKHHRPSLVFHNAYKLIEQPVRRRLWRLAARRS